MTHPYTKLADAIQRHANEETFHADQIYDDLSEAARILRAAASVVQAGEYPPLPVPTGQVVTLDMVDGRKARVIRAIDPHWMVGADGKTLFTEEQMRAYVDADRASRAPAVRMLTREELNDVALSDQVGWEPGEYIEAVQRKFCAVNAGRAIPPDGKIGGV